MKNDALIRALSDQQQVESSRRDSNDVVSTHTRDASSTVGSITMTSPPDPVLQEVLHMEPSTDIPPAEAAEIVQHQWAQ